MEKKYTLAEIRQYLQHVDSLGDALWYLKEFDCILENAKEPDEDEQDIDYIDLQE